jgi:CBS domain-containing protein
VARTDAPTCALDDRLSDIRSRLGGGEVCVVMNEAGVVAGILREEELEGADGERAEDAMRPGPSTYRPDVPIAKLAEAMTKHDLDSAPVTRPDGTLVGVLFRSDAVAAARGADE